jgi:SAM-dependent methyltransferase
MKKTPFFRKLRKERKRRRFEAGGRRPWTDGYDDYKREEIQRALESGIFSKGELPAGYGFRIDERIIEYPWLFNRMPTGPGKLLDAGSVLNFEFILSQPALANKKLHIVTLAPEGECFWRTGASYVYDDLRSLPYRDEWFDWIACLSTIEHVGMDNTMLYAADGKKEARGRDYLVAVRELRRVLKPGGTAWFTVPFGKAANLGWYQVFDEGMVEELIAAFAPSARSVEYFQYAPEGWRKSNAAETANATVFDIHHAKDYDPDFAAAARAVCCVEVKK